MLKDGFLVTNHTLLPRSLKIIVLLHLVCASSSGQSFEYTIQEIPLPSSSSSSVDYSEALSLNNRGEVVGRMLVGGTTRAFVWSSENGLKLLSDLPGSNEARAYDINDDGVVAGYSEFARALKWDGDEMEILLPPANRPQSFAHAINSSGIVAGAVGGNEVIMAAFWDAAGNVHELTSGSVNSINDSGIMVGASQANRARAWNLTGAEIILATPDGMTQSIATRINSQGQIAGRARIGATDFGVAVKWNSLNSEAEILPYLNSTDSIAEAYGISASGLVVGKSTNRVSNRVDRAVLWDDSNNPYDLQLLLRGGSDGWLLKEAMSINDLGQIAGFGDLNGRRRGFLLTPVPEPITIAPVFIGLVGILRKKTRRQS